jgi:TRAP-type C4-dicarboxylate transport system permease small subunit
MTKLLAGIATVLLSVMTLLVLYQVFTRYVLDSPAAFTEELVRYFLIWTGFIGAAYAFLTREHMCLVLFRDNLKPEKRRILMIVLDVLILVFAILVITVGGFKLAMSARQVYSALLGIPRSLVYGMAPVSGLFIIMAQIINIYEDVTGITIEGGKD